MPTPHSEANSELEPPGLDELIANSTWYAYFGSFLLAFAIRYYLDQVPAPERVSAFSDAAALAMDRPAVLEHHTPYFDGLLARQGPWVLAK